MESSSQDDARPANWAGFAWIVAWNAVVVGILAFCQFVVRIADAPAANRAIFYVIWGGMQAFGLVVLGHYLYHLLLAHRNRNSAIRR